MCYRRIDFCTGGYLHMIALSAHQVTSAISTLFDPSKPTMPRAFNVLEGTVRGQILVDDSVRPTWAMVQDATFKTLYFGGQLNAALVATLVAQFRQLDSVGIGCWKDDPLDALLPPKPNYDGWTLYFTERSPKVALPPLIHRLPPEHDLVLRDSELFVRSFDYTSTLAAFGTVERVLHHTLGVSLLYKNEVLCEAATGAPTHGRIELGVTTAEGERQRGLATITCAKLVALCEAKGYATWWDCAKQNEPSVRLARRLGYQNEREYRYVWWAKAG
jgi:hypothetical protein